MASRNAFFSSLDEVNRARIQMKEKLVKPRILVCTPSNAAVNAVVDGIMQQGFVDNGGNRYNPSILRLGSGTSEEYWSVSLEYMVGVGAARGFVVELSERRGEGGEAEDAAGRSAARQRDDRSGVRVGRGKNRSVRDSSNGWRAKSRRRADCCRTPSTPSFGA